MTELEVFARGKRIGTAQVQRTGLFLAFSAVLEPQDDALLRLYAVSGWHSEYLGIPSPAGQELRLSVRLPARHFSEEVRAVAADTLPRGSWLPWCGTLDGIPVRACRIRTTPDAMELALAETDAQQFPGWLSHMEEVQLGGETAWLLRLNADGSLPFSQEDELPLPPQEETVPEEAQPQTMPQEE